MAEKILLIGPGAVGVYFCGRLAEAGAEVSVVARSDYDTVKAHGYEIASSAGDFRFTPAAVLKEAAEYPGEPDWIIAATKVLPEIDLAGLMRGAIRSPHTRILLIQNGIFIEAPVAAAFPDNPLYSGAAYIGVARTAPGRFRHQDGGRLTFGRYGNRPPKAEAEALCARFRQTPIKTRLVDNISFYRWQKLLWNVPFNSVSVAAGGLDTRQMVDDPEIEALCLALMHEVVAAARLDGVELTEEMCQGNMQYTRDFVPYKTSMLLDYEAGRPMELDAIVGNIVSFAAERGLELPRLAAILALMRSLDRKNTGRDMA